MDQKILKQYLDLQNIGQNATAIDAYEKYLSSSPDSPEVICNFVQLLRQMGQALKAVQVLNKYRNYLHQDTYWQLNGLLEFTYGRPDEAAKCYLKATQLNRGNLDAYSQYLLMLNYIAGVSEEELYNAHCGIETLILEKFATCQVCQHVRKGKDSKKLTIGYLSGDFKRHSVAFFIESIIAQHDREQFQVILYSDVDKMDLISEQFKSLADCWRDVSKLTIQETVKQIYEDKVDILVELGGHTLRKLPCLAFKPAPVQISYLGYPNTTGLSTIDYRLTDALVDPVDQDRFYAERLLKQKDCFLCFAPPVDLAAPEEPAFIKNGYITFGSFNSLAKITPEVICTWSEILKQVPNSKLLLKNIAMRDEGVVEALKKQFSNQGIGQERLCIYSFIPDLNEHLELYSQVDISLDTFPYNGTTTTFESLWMGVPVITLYGSCHRSRVGYDTLCHLKLEDLCAETIETYIELAVNFALNRELQKSLRPILRNMLASSVLCDSVRFTRNLEDVYQKVWKRFLKKNS